MKAAATSTQLACENALDTLHACTEGAVSPARIECGRQRADGLWRDVTSGPEARVDDGDGGAARVMAGRARLGFPARADDQARLAAAPPLRTESWPVLLNDTSELTSRGHSSCSVSTSVGFAAETQDESPRHLISFVLKHYFLVFVAGDAWQWAETGRIAGKVVHQSWDYYTDRHNKQQQKHD